MDKERTKRAVVLATSVFVIVVACSLIFGSSYIKRKLLESNESMAVDFAELVKSSFTITDDEVTYMKSLTFNEMEVDAINLRLMNIKNEAQLDNKVTNVYLVAPLTDHEVKYYVDESNTDFYGYEPGTPLNAIWLLNGIFGEDGQFIATTREDINRYTHMSDELKHGFETKQAYSTFSSDEWGEFITGYTPIYTEEGNFVGLLGIDMDPDQYQTSVQGMMQILMFVFGVSLFALAVLFVVYFLKYEKEQKAKLYFDFYSRMSHDMRTPMNGILGMTHLAEYEEDPKELKKYLKKVSASGKYLLQLINDTLDISKISNGKMALHLEEVIYSQLIENIVDMVRMSAEEKKIDFVVEDKSQEKDSWVEVDQVRVKQILLNLLSNAIKFTPEGGTVRFIHEAEKKNADTMHCRFVISDTGIGMSEAFIKDELFHPFSQEYHETSYQSSGSGLGLAIAKMLIELMNGTISVHSELEKGTTFTIEMDVKRIVMVKQDVTVMLTEREEESFDLVKGKHILLCEDHPLNAEIAIRLLEKKGCIVDHVTNGMQGLEKYLSSQEGFYDVILMDIKMPVMNGLEATAAIRAAERLDAQTVPIVAMTANAYAEDVENSKKAGMNRHLSKPIDPKVVYATIAEVLREVKK